MIGIVLHDGRGNALPEGTRETIPHGEKGTVLLNKETRENLHLNGETKEDALLKGEMDGIRLLQEEKSNLGKRLRGEKSHRLLSYLLRQ